MKRPSRVAHIAEFRRQHHLIAPALKGAANQFLVVAAAVGVGRIEEIDAKVEGAMDRRHRLLLLLGTIEFGHAHATQPEG